LRPVGIIANPASGKDIRRLVAYGSVFSNREKINVVKRVLLGLDAAGVEEVLLMPDACNITRRAVDDLKLNLKPVFLDMIPEDNQDDSTKAAAKLTAADAACIIVLGGDGTNRVVAKTCGQTPLLPIATGTNNVFSHMLEGTLAGMAAGIMASNAPETASLTIDMPRLEIWRDDTLMDISLIDIVVSTSSFVGTRAIWDVDILKEIYLTRSDFGNIGFSSLGGYLHPQPLVPGTGLRIVVGPGGTQVKAPIAPGLVRWVPVASFNEFNSGDSLPIINTPVMLALDGERELRVLKDDTAFIRINPRGPKVVNLEKVFQRAHEQELFVATQMADHLSPP
jgi:hypothetical protein